MTATVSTAPSGATSQKELVLCHLKRFGSIEPLTALREYGCYRLGARIADLRREGYNITTQHVSAISKITRRTVTFAKYTLINSSPA